MLVIDLVHFVGLGLMLLISCRTCSAGGWINVSLSSASRGEHDESMMTSPVWCDTSIQCKMLQVLFAVLKGSVTSRDMQCII